MSMAAIPSYSNFYINEVLQRGGGWQAQYEINTGMKSLAPSDIAISAIVAGVEITVGGDAQWGAEASVNSVYYTPDAKSEAVIVIDLRTWERGTGAPIIDSIVLVGVAQGQ